LFQRLNIPVQTPLVLVRQHVVCCCRFETAVGSDPEYRGLPVLINDSGEHPPGFFKAICSSAEANPDRKFK
jgi:hypothetical protein